MSVGCIIGHNRLVGTDSGKPRRTDFGSSGGNYGLQDPAGKSRKQQLRLLQKRRRINANPAKRIQERKRLPLMVNAIWH